MLLVVKLTSTFLIYLDRLKDIEIYYPKKSAKLCALTVIAYIISKDVKIWTDGQKSL